MTPAERARKERAAQGLGPHVEDDVFLDWLVGLLWGADVVGGDLDAGRRRRAMNRKPRRRGQAAKGA